MKTRGCFLLLGALLSLSAKGPSSTTSPQVDIKIQSCKPPASQDQVGVQVGTKVIWHADGQSYTITFDKKNDPPGSSNDITPTSLSLPANGTATWDTTGTPTDCGVAGQGCYFKYNISVGSTVCNDPGVRVVPPF